MIEIVTRPPEWAFSGNNIFCEFRDTDSATSALVVHIATQDEEGVKEVFLLDNTRLVRFNAGPYAHGFLQSQRDVPALDGVPAAALLPQGAREFVIRVQPIQAGVAGAVQAVTGFWALQATFTPETEWLPNAVFSQHMWLSLAPNPQPLAVGAVLHTSYLNNSRRHLKLVARYTLADNGQQVTRVLRTDYVNEGVLHFAVSWASLAAEIPTFKQVDVWLRNELNANVSTMRSFYVLRLQPLRYLLFSNSLGGFDTLPVQGIAQEGATYTRQVARVDLIDYVIDVERSTPLQIRLAPLAATWSMPVSAANFLVAELLPSRSIYLVTGERITELRAVTEEITHYTDKLHTEEFELKFLAVRVAKSFTQPTLALPPDAEEGYFESGYINTRYFT